MLNVCYLVLVYSTCPHFLYQVWCLCFHRVPEDMPLYDILNEFQKGGSHMAAVVKVKSNKRKFTKRASFGAHKEERKGFKEYHIAEVDTEKLPKSPYAKMNGESSHKPIEENSNSETGRHDDGAEGLDEVDVIGIITMEDIMEELLQVSVHALVYEVSNNTWVLDGFLHLYNRVVCKVFQRGTKVGFRWLLVLFY